MSYHQMGLSSLMKTFRAPPRFLLGLLLLSGLPLRGHDPVTTRLTWSREISRILAARCMGCHQSGGQAPFALTTYVEARPWAVAIREEIAARRMPPSNAVRGFGRLAQNSSLSQEEIQLIADWANGGAPEGDAKFLDPALPPLAVPAVPPDLPRIEALDGALVPPGTLEGLLVRDLPAGAGVRLLLESPSGRLTPLAWLRPLSPHAPPYYRFLTPLAVPAGSTLRLWPERSPAPAPRLELLLAPSPSPR